MGNEYGWNNRYDYSDNALAGVPHVVRGQVRDRRRVERGAGGTAFWSQHAAQLRRRAAATPHGRRQPWSTRPSSWITSGSATTCCSTSHKAERDAIEQKSAPASRSPRVFMVSTSDQCAMRLRANGRTRVDFVSNDHYFHEGESHLDQNSACSDALMDSLALGKPWYVMEHSTSAVQVEAAEHAQARRRAHARLLGRRGHGRRTPSASSNGGNPQSGAEAFHSAECCPTRAPIPSCLRA